MKSQNKTGSTFWLHPETVQRMDSLLAMDNCKSRSEFAEKALRFYMGYITSEDVTGYLSKALAEHGLPYHRRTLQGGRDRSAGTAPLRCR